MDSPWRSQFPAISGSSGAYLDSASTCQVPDAVIESMNHYLREGHGNPHRGMYKISEVAEQYLDDCRNLVAKRFKCQANQVAFSSGTTESINQVAHSFRDKISADQTIVTTQMEHHANLLPWQRLSQLTGAKLVVLPVESNGELSIESIEKALSSNCALLAIAHTSNVTGVTNPIQEIIKLARSYDVVTLVDGAQAVAHLPVDLEKLGCDFYVFSAHKMYGPAGIGVLYIRDPLLIEPGNLGGGIVTRVSDYDYSLTDQVTRFEAGTINMPGIVGFQSALTFLESINYADIHQHEQQLMQPLKVFMQSSDFRVISHGQNSHLLSFTSDQFHSHDIATILAEHRVAVRAGHHCAQPLLTALGLKHCVRVSLGLYNNQDEIQRLINALKSIPEYLK